MKFAVITTTINIPEVIKVYAALSDDVSIIITGDKKSPDAEIRAFCAAHGNVTYLDVADQIAMGLRCSDIIGWNTIQRRNIALLAAIRQGADVIVTIDDDNFPCAATYFDDFQRLFRSPFYGLSAETHAGWFDVGQLFEAPFHHRGVPLDIRDTTPEISCAPQAGARIGVAAGLWLGDPDVDATTRIAMKPVVKGIPDILQQGITVRPGTWTVFNSQNTAYLEQLAPLMMVWPATGRYDDIWASYAAQRVMRDSEYHIHFGAPLVWQQRNQQNLVTNLAAEVHGMEHTPTFLKDLDALELQGGTHLDRFKSLWQGMERLDYIPDQTVRAGLAWCEDVYDVLKGRQGAV